MSEHLSTKRVRIRLPGRTVQYRTSEVGIQSSKEERYCGQTEHRRRGNYKGEPRSQNTGQR
jgi:hypothetical protein